MDNLYSADDSDAESFSNELSPTDGYFTNRDHRQNVMVPDPSLENQSLKAQEAREESRFHSHNQVVNDTISPDLVTSSPPLRTSGHDRSATDTSASATTHTPHSPSSPYIRQDDLYTGTYPLLHSVAPPDSILCFNITIWSAVL
jgi:hypothetical protein